MDKSKEIYLSTKKRILTDILDSITLTEHDLDVDGDCKIIFGMKKNHWHFEYHKITRILYISYIRIWQIYEKAYLMEYNEIGEFIGDEIIKRYMWDVEKTILNESEIKMFALDIKRR